MGELNRGLRVECPNSLRLGCGPSPRSAPALFHAQRRLARAGREFTRVAKKVIREYERHERTCLPCCGLLLRLLQKPLDVRRTAAHSHSAACRRDSVGAYFRHHVAKESRHYVAKESATGACAELR